MISWPKEWLEAADPWNVNKNPEDPWFAKRPAYILDCLHEVGALKDPPRPREWWMCENCHAVGKVWEDRDSKAGVWHRGDCNCKTFVLLKEVLKVLK